MGSNNGTGQPNYFRCSKCRLTVRGPRHGWDVTLTGRRRAHRGKRGARITGIDREYACNDCGHVGWSAHIDLCDRMGDHRYHEWRDGALHLPSYVRTDVPDPNARSLDRTSVRANGCSEGREGRKLLELSSSQNFHDTMSRKMSRKNLGAVE